MLIKLQFIYLGTSYFGHDVDDGKLQSNIHFILKLIALRSDYLIQDYVVNRAWHI